MLDRAKVRVVIVGGGMAGLSAAQHLYANGFKNVTLVEARDRLGGRIQTQIIGGKDLVEMGANWILGACAANPAFVLAKQNNIQLGRITELTGRWVVEDLWIKPDGTVIGANIVQRAMEEFRQILGQVSEKTKSLRVNPVGFIKVSFTLAIQDMSGADQRDALCIMRSMVNFLQVYDGGYLERSRGKGEPFNPLPGGAMCLPDGMQFLLDSLTKDLPSDSVQLNSQVVSIDWSDPECRVTCEGGRTHEADHVIISLPVGVLKQHRKKLFIPHLPAKKAEAINTVPMGKLNKIFLRWEKPFWEPGMGAIQLCWSDDDAEPLDWWRRIPSFLEVGPNVLLAMVSGEQAEHLESFCDQEILEKCSFLIRQFLRNPSIASPDQILVSRWCSDPYSRGSFIYQGTNVTEEILEELGSPLEEHRVLFAGEATVPWAYGKMHAARASGLREAERIIGLY
ncbi:hypothetical protein CAPTEDRAFT_114517 [Capitella teleta]|uniref:Amine oxidase domain-containing protein n=1 Tax=Capitella teleta TaxID=283909 RepID=R7TIX2_CAPTE|nr:hypothetical protein CAPTEDRAFT_114517 [Capitella teleta]|eukprot:ELT91045.1 hypothetical protein CAPTEDRAFT_114517 [Capitella teleta]